MDYRKLSDLDPDRPDNLPDEIIDQIDINIKYDGYIKRKLRQVDQLKKKKKKLIPESIVYDDIHNLRSEAVQKLNKIRPVSVGQASRISGVSPSDISVLLIHIEQMNRSGRS